MYSTASAVATSIDQLRTNSIQKRRQKHDTIKMPATLMYQSICYCYDLHAAKLHEIDGNNGKYALEDIAC